MDQNAPITSKDVFPKRSAKMIDGTENLEIPLNFAKRTARYREFGYKWGFFGVLKTNLSIFRVISFHASWKFLLLLGNSAWDFLEDKFWSSDFFGVLIFAPIRSSSSLEIRSTP